MMSKSSARPVHGLPDDLEAVVASWGVSAKEIRISVLDHVARHALLIQRLLMPRASDYSCHRSSRMPHKELRGQDTRSC